MLISISLCLLFVFGFKDSVVCETTSIKLREEKSGETRYPFNHPPSVEFYDPIPVAVVYEDSNDFSGKPGTKAIPDLSEEYEEVKSDEEILIASKYDINTSTQENMRTTDINANSKINKKNETKPEVTTKSRALKEFQIPVAVVYDSEPINNNDYQRTKTETKPEILMVRSNYALKKNIQHGTKQNSQTTVVEDKHSQQLGEIKTFKKRTRDPEPVIPIIDMDSYVFSHNGQFRCSYEGGDGTKAFSEGKQITVDEGAGEAVVGGFSYKGIDGKDISLTYTADENGYRPVGDHLPTPPPIPPAIARALAYLATATSEPVTKPPKIYKV